MRQIVAQSIHVTGACPGSCHPPPQPKVDRRQTFLPSPQHKVDRRQLILDRTQTVELIFDRTQTVTLPTKINIFVEDLNLISVKFSALRDESLTLFQFLIFVTPVVAVTLIIVMLIKIL